MSNKRLDGEGSISWYASSNRYRVRLQKDGKRIAKYAMTLKEAKDLLRDLQRKSEDNVLVTTPKTRMKDYLPEWLEMEKPSLKPKSYEGYEWVVRKHLIPALGHIKLGKLTEEHIQAAWTKMLEEGKSPTLIAHCHRRLSKALNEALRRKKITRNPMQFVKQPKIESRELKTLSVAEIESLLKVAEGSEYYALIHTALYTGLRRNELLGLKWKDIDLDMSVIHLNRNIHRKHKVTIEQTPKTKAGRRSVNLTPKSTVLLQKILEEAMAWDTQNITDLSQKEVKKIWDTLRSKVDNEQIFLRPTGTPILPNSASNYMSTIAEKAGVDIRLHGMRHTHAALMLKKNVHPKIVQERLGHSRIDTTMDIYSHVMPNLQKDAADSFDKIFQTSAE